MHHAKDIDLIELAAGRLDPAKTEAVSSHVDTCHDCRRKLERLRQMWGILGSWSVDAPHRLTVPSAVMRRGREPRMLRLAAHRAAFRIAASIAVAAILGYAGGWWTKKPARAAVPVDAPAYLSALGSQVADGLSLLILSDESSPTEGG